MTQLEFDFSSRRYNGRRIADAKNYVNKTLYEMGIRKFAWGWMGGNLHIYMEDGRKKDGMPMSVNGVEVRYVFF